MAAGNQKRREIALMFSGGIDSTMAAILLAEQYDRVHLLTYGNGYGHYHLDRTRRRADELRQRCGDRFEHAVVSVQDLFERYLPEPEAEFRRYRSGFVWCLGCKLAMHTRSILYNLEHRITEMTDGSSKSTGEMVEQMPVCVNGFREFYSFHGITFSTPVYDIPREQEIEALRSRGFRLGLRIGDRFLGIQPKCRPGELYYLPFLLLRQRPRHDEDRVLEFLAEKRELAERIIAERCGQLGIAVPAAAGR